MHFGARSGGIAFSQISKFCRQLSKMYGQFRGQMDGNMTAGSDYTGFVCSLLPWRHLVLQGSCRPFKNNKTFLIKTCYKTATFFILDLRESCKALQGFLFLWTANMDGFIEENHFKIHMPKSSSVYIV